MDESQPVIAETVRPYKRKHKGKSVSLTGKKERNEQVKIKKFQCRFCTYRTLWKSWLDRHTIRCNGTSRRTHKLKKHVVAPKPNVSCEKDSVFKCQACGLKFSCKGNLTRHMKTHDGNHQCQECGICYINLMALNRHMKKHTIRKPITCRQCQSVFLTKHQLHLHRIMTHSEDDVFLCEICNEKFVTKMALCRHRKREHLTVLKDKASSKIGTPAVVDEGQIQTELVTETLVVKTEPMDIMVTSPRESEKEKVSDAGSQKELPSELSPHCVKRLPRPAVDIQDFINQILKNNQRLQS